MNPFLRIVILASLIPFTTAVSARTADTSIATNLPIHLTGEWCLNKQVFDDDVSHKGEIWNFSADNKYTFNGLGEDPFEIQEDKIKMTHFGTLEVLEISEDEMVAKIYSTYYFTKSKCSEETQKAIKLTRLNNSIITNDIEAVKKLIDEGVDVSKKDTRSAIQSTPLMVAIREENIPMIKLILLEKPDLTVKNFVDKTAMHYAKLTKSREIQELIRNAY